MTFRKLFYPLALCFAGGSAFPQQPSVVAPPKPKAPPKVSTTIPSTGIHLSTNLGSFKIKRGSEALNYGRLEMTFKGTVAVSGLNGTIVPTNGTELELSQPKYKKLVYHSKGDGKLSIIGQFDGIQFFGEKVSAYYRGDGVLSLYGEFDKDLNTGLYWYDQTPNNKRFWGTNGLTITPTPYIDTRNQNDIKIKDVPAKG
jgi:hypothetical protein